MWVSWHVGIAIQNISPLKHLKAKYRSDIPTKYKYLVDKAALVMAGIEKVARRKGYMTATESIDSSNCVRIWNSTFKDYLSLIYSQEEMTKESFRPDDIYYTTLHKRHTKKHHTTEGDKIVNIFDNNFAEMNN